MAKIRVYVCNWEKIGNRVTNPIGKFADSLENIPGLKWISYHYAEARADGTPNNPFCIAFIKADDFTDFDSVGGVVKLPVGNLSENLSGQVKNGIINAIRGEFNIPRAVLSSAVNRKDIIVNLARYIHPQFKNIGNVKDEEFE